MSPKRRDRSVEAERAQLRGFARSIAEVEWLVLVLVLLYLFVTQPLLESPPVVFGALGAFALVLLVLRYAPPLSSRARLKTYLEVLAIVALLTVVLSQIGGQTSPLVTLYVLPIAAAGLTLDRRATALVTTLVCLCYVLLPTVEGGAAALDEILLADAVVVLVPFVLVALLTNVLAENLRTARSRIRDLSDRDLLTSLLNIAAFMRLAERDHNRAAHREGTYSILLVDVDQLKQINDAYGHEAGNRALRVVAEALLRVTGSKDLVARFGGDEFITYLADSEITAATEIAQRLRSVVYAATFEVNLDIVRVQVSVGLANYPVDGETLEQVMAVADQAMYTDKELRATPEGQLVIQKR